MTELSVFAATVLPVSGILPELLSTLAGTDTAILQAPPGSGKTTRVPLALLEAEPDWLAGRHILMLEPRRLAARAAATGDPQPVAHDLLLNFAVHDVVSVHDFTSS